MTSTNTQTQIHPQAKPSLTLAIPSWILALAKIVDYGAKTASSVGESVEDVVGKAEEKVKSNPLKKIKLPKIKINFSGNKIKELVRGRKKIVGFVLVVLVVGAGVVAWKAKSNNDGIAQGASEQTNVNSGGVVNINKSIEIAIRTKDGKETGEKLKVTIATMEQAKEILIQGKPAKAKDGKAFLLITMEIENPTKKQLTVKPIDMVRMVNSEGKTLAAEVHNNEVTSEPVSIKKTRIGYVINEAEKNFKFLIGEVRGTQEPIEVSF